MRTTAEKLALATGLLGAVITAWIPMLVMSRHGDAYASFGAYLPQITRLFVDYSLVYWLLPLLVLAGWLYWPERDRRALVACLIGVFGLFLLTPITVVAMYLPIFKLEAAL